MAHRWWIIAALLCFSMLFPGCKNYEKENKHLKDELRMLREENDYLKAEIIGLKKELAELSAKVQEEQAELRRKFEEERAELRKRLQEEREAMQKRAAQDAGKKNSAAKIETKAPPAKETSGTTKNQTKEGGAKGSQRRTDDSGGRAPAGQPRQ